MTLGIHAKVLLHMWSYDFYDTTLSTELQRRHMINVVFNLKQNNLLPFLSCFHTCLFVNFYRYLDDVALHHLIDALCKLSTESMELAYSNRVSAYFESIN